MRRALPLCLLLSACEVAAPTSTGSTALSSSQGFGALVGPTGTQPRLTWATGPSPAQSDDPVRAARAHLEAWAASRGVPAEALAQDVLHAVHHLPQLGVVVQLRRRAAGLPVYPSEVRVLMRSDLSLVAISGALLPVLAPNKDDLARLDEAQALAAALSHAGRPTTEDELRLSARDDGQSRFEATPPSTLVLPHGARVRPILYRLKTEVVRAYLADFYLGTAETPDGPALRSVIAAADGRVLQARNLTFDAAFNYRVWAENSGDLRPLDGTVADFSPHPTGIPDDFRAPQVPANLVTVEAFNTNPSGGSDPWLTSSAVDTRGNNVDAYVDHNAPDGFSNGDLRATTTGPRTFDHVYDPTLEPAANPEQSMAAITQLFFSLNWLHDYWYDSGFDEAAGNAQRNNFGRGGEGGDPLLAEAQDSIFSGSRNNANMSTPDDGLSPRLQVYVWSGRRTATVGLSSTPNPLNAGVASFGPSTFALAGPVVLADDGAGVGTDGCEPIVNNVAGGIALVDRGTCSFGIKAINAQNAGAIAMILANNRAGGPPSLGGTPPAPVNIPSLSITDLQGNDLKAALQVGPVQATLTRTQEPDVEASFDSSMVAHEWGHYLHNRLADCGNLQCRGMGEGWGDFLGLHTQLRPGDDLQGTYAGAGYATSGRVDGTYFGTRRFPYTVDAAKNALSLRHISDGEPMPAGPMDPSGAPNSEVHNTGEIWASMLFEGYVALIEAGNASTPSRSFEQVRRVMSRYVVASLLLTPDNATFTEARDALLAAALAASPADFEILAEAFARRGAGTCAVAPPRDSGDNTGVLEDSQVRPQLILSDLQIDDGAFSCDGDGILDAEERGRVRLIVKNVGHAPSVGGRVVLTPDQAEVSLSDGGVVPLPTLAPLSQVELSLGISAVASLSGPSTLALAARLESPDGCTETQTSTAYVPLDSDEVAGATQDPVSAKSSAWTPGGVNADRVWARTQTAPQQGHWTGLSFTSHSDTWLVSPALNVGPDPFVLRFDHRYEFEAVQEDGTDTNWDGGVIELSADGGQTWQDLETWADPGYRGVLTDTSGNPLAGRRALVGTSTSWPDFSPVQLDLGTTFASQTVQVRFRIGTDAAVTRHGWDLDNFEVLGIVNAPFIQVVQDATVCPRELRADAGEDQTAAPNTAILLDGSGSESFAGRPLSYAWTQVAGPAVQLQRPNEVLAAWSAPALTAETVYTFELWVDDGTLQATDRVDITVAGTTPQVLEAVAGPDQEVPFGAQVVLNGSRSRGPTGLNLAWTQIEGPAVALSDADTAVAQFDAPRLDTTTQLVFQLTATADTRTDVDALTVTVQPVGALVADAGPDQSVQAGATVTLDARGSRGPAPLTFAWAQVSGPALTLLASDGPTPAFEAPSAPAPADLSFEVTVSDGVRVVTDDVKISVAAAPSPPPLEDGGCTCLRDRPSGGFGLFALGWLLLWGRFRRRGGPPHESQDGLGPGAPLCQGGPDA